MVDDNITEKILEIVGNYLNDNKILEEHKEINQNRKNISENEIKPLIFNFFKENIKIDEFKTKNDSLNKIHSLWGFKGTAGAMFFNQLYNAEDDKERLEKEIRKYLLEPDDINGAKVKIDRFSNYVREVGEKVELRQKTPAPKSTVFFLSYFWHIQAPDKYPIFYPQSRKALKNLGLFDEAGRDDYSDLYVEFLNNINDVSQILETKKSRKFSFDEISNILYWYVDKKKENVWKCPKESCDNQVINIKRTQNIIETGTWREIIIHILEHLNQNVLYFGPSTIEKFLEESIEDLLVQEDKKLIEYERKEGAERAKAKDLTWKNRMRSALAQIKIDGYIETDKSSDNDTFQAHYRSRRRTEKFFNDFETYDDWSDIEEGLQIEYALRDEKVNIFAMTKGTPSSEHTHQVILCKKSKMTRLGPFILDPKTSKPEFELSDYGKNYQNQIWKEDYELKYIAYIDSQIKIKISYDLFVDLEKEGFFVIWHPDAPFSYFTDKKEGYLVLFKIYTIDKIISETLLNKGRRGRNYYYSLEHSVFVKKVEDIIPDNQFNVIKQNLINLLKQNKSFIEIIENPVFSDKHFIWQMIKEASENLAERRDGIFTISEIKDFILKNYGDVNESAINSGIIAATVNHDSRIHYNENKKPRIANSHYDFLYRIEKGKGDLELYDQRKHGIWQINTDLSGNPILQKNNKTFQDLNNYIKKEFTEDHSNVILILILYFNKDMDFNLGKLAEYINLKFPELTQDHFKSSYQKIVVNGIKEPFPLFFTENSEFVHLDWVIRKKIDSYLLTETTIKPNDIEYKFPKRELLSKNLLDPAEIRKLENLLKKHKQIILFGPPGTGKTYFAEVLAQSIAENRFELIQFHSSYSYDDFIETIEVKTTPDGKSVIYSPKACVFRKLCEMASKLDEEAYVVLVIDEINRGDLSRIFGELILSLEKSQRNKEIRTPLSDTLGLLKIPHNLLIIGTMNSVDRSIAIVDYALRRRFLFYKILPEKSILEKWLEYKSVNNDLKRKILNLFENLNEEIRKDEVRLGEHHQIGHTYFFVESEFDLKTNWDYMIEPLLEEYLNFKSEYLKTYRFEELVKDRIKE